MSRIIIEATHIDPNVCFECGAPATERHHVVPVSPHRGRMIVFATAVRSGPSALRGPRDSSFAGI